LTTLKTAQNNFNKAEKAFYENRTAKTAKKLSDARKALNIILSDWKIITNYDEETRIQMKELEYLKTNVFNGLENLNNGFDVETIYYFSESDFEIVLDRVEKNGIAIFGIEPWIGGEFYAVLAHEDFNADATDPKWYRKAFAEFKESGKELMYAASYEVPKKLLSE